MTVRSTDASEDQPVESSSSKVEAVKQAGTDGDGEVEGEGAAPVHDASSAVLKAPTAMKAQDKVELTKVAQTLREDAAEGERGQIHNKPVRTRALHLP